MKQGLLLTLVCATLPLSAELSYSSEIAPAAAMQQSVPPAESISSSTLTVLVRSGDIAALTKQLDVWKQSHNPAQSDDIVSMLMGQAVFFQQQNYPLFSMLLEHSSQELFPQLSTQLLYLLPTKSLQKALEAKDQSLAILHYVVARSISVGALCLAAQLGYTDLLQRVVQRQPELVNAHDDDATCIMHQNERYARSFLEPYLFPSIKGRSTPLHYGAKYGQRKSVEVLLAAGARVNLRDSWGWSPLMYAAAQGHGEIVELMLTAGAANSYADAMGHTARELAVQRGYGEVAAHIPASSSIEMLKPANLMLSKKEEENIGKCQSSVRNGKIAAVLTLPLMGMGLDIAGCVYRESKRLNLINAAYLHLGIQKAESEAEMLNAREELSRFLNKYLLPKKNTLGFTIDMVAAQIVLAFQSWGSSLYSWRVASQESSMLPVKNSLETQPADEIFDTKGTLKIRHSITGKGYIAFLIFGATVGQLPRMGGMI